MGGSARGEARARACWWSTAFAVPSALDDRPLEFEEFQALQGQTKYVSATPTRAGNPVVGRPHCRSKLSFDQKWPFKPLEGQIDNLLEEVRKRSDAKKSARS